MNNKMDLTWIADKACWRFFNSNEPAREVFFSPEEINFIGKELKRNAWRNEIEYRLCIDEDSIEFSGEIGRQEFVSLCIDDINDRMMIYGDDYAPDIENIVFDVAQENGIWRD